MEMNVEREICAFTGFCPLEYLLRRRAAVTVGGTHRTA
jgi:hypothetical protein